jgi:hypothetical protein
MGARSSRWSSEVRHAHSLGLASLSVHVLDAIYCRRRIEAQAHQRDEGVPIPAPPRHTLSAWRPVPHTALTSACSLAVVYL